MKLDLSIEGLKGLSALWIACILHYILLCGPIVFEEVDSYICIITISLPQVFFVVSGFLTSFSIKKKRSIAQYMIPKIIKLYPQVILSVFIIYFIEKGWKNIYGEFILYGKEKNYNILSLILNCLGFQSGWIGDKDAVAVNGPTWFLSILFICYILHYFINKIDNTRVRIMLYFVLYFGGIIIMLFPANKMLLFVDSGQGYCGYYGGVLLGVLIGKKEDLQRKPYKGVIFVFYMIVQLLIMNWLNASMYALASCVAWFLVVFCTIYGNVINWLLSRKAFVFLGEISMSIFIWNMPTYIVIEIARRQLGFDYNSIFVWLCVVIVDVVVAYVLHRIFSQYVTKPLLRLYSKKINKTLYKQS